MQRSIGSLVVLALVIGLAAPAAAQRNGDRTHLELVAGLGVADRSSTGSGSALAGLGYDEAAGGLAVVDVRLLVPADGEYFHTGLVLRAGTTAGPNFGAGSVGMWFSHVDVGFGARTILPCLSRGDAKLYLGGYAAVSGGIADAGLGDGMSAGDPRLANERQRAARELDHGSVGFGLGLNFDAHFGAFVIGAQINLHQFYGVETVVARDTQLDVLMRIGGDITL